MLMRKAFLVCVVLFFLSAISIRTTFAANTTFGLSPNSGFFNKPFTVNIVIDGHEDKFNAAQATVSLSQNLSIKDLTLGDCNFTFLKTPSIQNPSFTGVIISTYATKCTAYTLTLVPTAKGNASITLSKASVKRYGDAAETFSSAQKGSYILSGVSKDASTLGSQTKNTSQTGLYTLYLKVYSSSNIPVSNANVILNTVSANDKQQATTDSSGVAHFSNLKAGVYDAVINQGFSKVGETIVNVSGPNHVLSLSIDLSSQKNNPLMKAGSLLTTLTTNPIAIVGVLVAGILVGVGIALLVIKLLGRRKNKV